MPPSGQIIADDLLGLTLHHATKGDGSVDDVVYVPCADWAEASEYAVRVGMAEE